MSSQSSSFPNIITKKMVFPIREVGRHVFDRTNRKKKGRDWYHGPFTHKIEMFLARTPPRKWRNGETKGETILIVFFPVSVLHVEYDGTQRNIFSKCHLNKMHSLSGNNNKNVCMAIQERKEQNNSDRKMESYREMIDKTLAKQQGKTPTARMAKWVTSVALRSRKVPKIRERDRLSHHRQQKVVASASTERKKNNKLLLFSI